MTFKRSPRGTPILGIAGWKNSGKTTLTVRLIAEFSKRGLTIATVKHAHHEFQIDDAETDSARHRRAGAAQVAIVSSSRWALVTELRDEPEPDFDAVIAKLSPSDLVIVEGYKTTPIAKIEVRRAGASEQRALAADDPNVIAIAADEPTAHQDPIPVFHLDDVETLAAFIATRLDIKRQPRPR